jgi:hypothetical protein
MSLIPNIIPLWVKAGAIALVFAIAIGATARVSYKYGYNESDVLAKAAVIHQRDTDLKAQADIMAKRQELEGKYNKLAFELQDTQQQLKEAKVNVKVKVVKEIQSNPVYHTCVMPVTGVRLINDQATQLNNIRHGTR